MFSCSGSLYGLPAEAAAEVVNLPGLTGVPGAPRHLMGVFAHRGEVIPVIDLSLLVGGSAGSYRRAVLVRLPRGSLALASTRVHGVVPVAGALQRLGESGVQASLLGPATCPAGDVVVIDVEGLFELLGRGG